MNLWVDGIAWGESATFCVASKYRVGVKKCCNVLAG